MWKDLEPDVKKRFDGLVRVVPVVIVKKAEVSFCLWLDAKGGVEVRGADAGGSGQESGRASPIADAIAPFWLAGKAGTLADGAKFGMDGAAGVRALPGLYSEYLPNGIDVAANGTKWLVAGGAKAGKHIRAEDEPRSGGYRGVSHRLSEKSSVGD